MANKQTDSYEDQVRREFESTQNDGQEVVRDLGKVNLNGGIDLNDEPEIQRIKATMDYVNIPLDMLPSSGKFYPENTKISIRAARVNEIREFSIIDESDPKDVRDKIVYIVSQCIKVYYGNTPGHFKDILEEDKTILLFKIRELTFVNHDIKIDIPEGACKTPGCHPQGTVDFNSNKIVLKKPSELVEKYYDSVERCYNVQTKRFGVIKLYPPTIGTTSIIVDWVKKQQAENKNIDSALADLLPYTINSWRSFSEKQVFSRLTDLAGWSTDKFNLFLRLKEEINLGIEFDMIDQCAQCGGELKIPIIFPGGLRSLFVQTISDLRDELL